MRIFESTGQKLEKLALSLARFAQRPVKRLLPERLITQIYQENARRGFPVGPPIINSLADSLIKHGEPWVYGEQLQKAIRRTAFHMRSGAAFQEERSLGLNQLKQYSLIADIHIENARVLSHHISVTASRELGEETAGLVARFQEKVSARLRSISSDTSAAATEKYMRLMKTLDEQIQFWGKLMEGAAGTENASFTKLNRISREFLGELNLESGLVQGGYENCLRIEHKLAFLANLPEIVISRQIASLEVILESALPRRLHRDMHMARLEPGLRSREGRVEQLREIFRLKELVKSCAVAAGMHAAPEEKTALIRGKDSSLPYFGAEQIRAGGALGLTLSLTTDGNTHIGLSTPFGYVQCVTGKVPEPYMRFVETFSRDARLTRVWETAAASQLSGAQVRFKFADLPGKVVARNSEEWISPVVLKPIWHLAQRDYEG